MRDFLRIAILLAGGVLASTTPVAAVAAPQAAFTASRSEACVAPCAVFFDATATSDPSTDAPFLDLDHRWDFGDAQGEVWSVSGLSKNEAIGGIAGHLFTKPGVFTVTLVVTNRAGDRASAQQQIRIDDPDVVFAGEKTVCVSASGDFGGCPAGAARTRSSDFDAALANLPGRRTLFRRGETFAWDRVVRLAEASGRGASIGVFGGGTQRATLRAAAGARASIDPGNDWRLAHVELEGAGADFSAIDEKGGVARFTVWDVAIRGFNGCATFWSPPKPDAEVAFVDVRCSDFPDPGGGTKFYEDTERSMFLGLEIDKGDKRDPRDNTEFAYRTVYSQKKLIQHGRFRGRAPNHSKNLLQLRHCSAIGKWAERCPDGANPSRHVIVSDNHFMEGGGPHAMTVIRVCDHGTCGGKPGESQRVEDYVIERNLFQVDVRDAASETLTSVVDMQASRSTVRNNVADLQGWPLGGQPRMFFVIPIAPSNAARDPGGRVSVLHNTVLLGRGFPRSLVLCGRGGTIAGGVCANNLVVAPGLRGEATTVFGKGWTDVGNRILPDVPFTAGLPAALRATRRDLSAFSLAPGATPGAAVDPGAGAAIVRDDVSGRCRTKPTDVGAVARKTVPCASGQGG
jgi:hypothetical protein